MYTPGTLHKTLGLPQKKRVPQKNKSSKAATKKGRY